MHFLIATFLHFIIATDKQLEKGNQDFKSEIQQLRQDKEILQDRFISEYRQKEKSEHEYSNLVVDYNDMVDFFNSIPEDLRQELWDMHIQKQEVAQEQDMEWDEMEL